MFQTRGAGRFSALARFPTQKFEAEQVKMLDPSNQLSLKNLRDLRHVGGVFPYNLVNSLFFDPYDLHYDPSKDYLDLVAELVEDYATGWAITRDGLWFHAHPVNDGQGPSPVP
jgi:hypothetical protein